MAVKSYGKKGKDNIALQFDRLQISSPNKYGALAEVDGNRRDFPQQPELKKKANKNKTHRKSLVYNTCDGIDRAEIDTPTTKYLDPLLCLQQVNSSVQVFGDWARVWSTHCNFVKIAQGTYGAVFRIKSKTQQNTFTIGKLIPLQARTGWGSKTRDFTTIGAAANEVSFLSALDELPGFVQFRKAEVLQGALPTTLKQASADFDAAQEEGDIPKRWTLACSKSTQLWLFLEMSDAGTDLETVLVKSLPETPPGTSGLQAEISAVGVRDIFWQAASALALAEKKFNFEHRDLHLGNICLKHSGYISRESGLELWTDKPSILVTIIDYTLSRMDTPSQQSLYNDLSKDPALFEGVGARQYDVYRQMKTHFNNDWSSYKSITNVLWLAHLLVLLMETRASQTCCPLEQKSLWDDLAGLKRCLIDDDKKMKFTSAQDVVRYCEAGASEWSG